MAYQAIFLGTPNNNDGDSLYAGGAKINANFGELYTGLAGSLVDSLRINLGSGNVADPTTSQTLMWSAANQAFIPSSSNMMTNLADNGSSGLILTNSQGKAGADLEHTGQANSLTLFINGRPFFAARASTTGNVAATRGTLLFGMGNPRATSLAISTRGVAVGGDQGLTVYRNVTEESQVSSLVIGTGSSGAILYETPLTSNYVAPSDSSNAIVNSGFVQAAITRRGFAFSSTTILSGAGLVGGGVLASSQTLSINPNTFNNLCNGLLYSYQANGTIQVEPGSAAHFSFSVSGATVISQSSVIAIATLNNRTQRSWNNTTTWTPTNSNACIDIIAGNTWYYIYLVANNSTGAADFVVTDSRDYAGINIKLGVVTSQFSVVRRIGAFRTTAFAGSIVPEPFITRKVDNNTIRIEWIGNSRGYNTSLTVTSNVVGQVATLTVQPAAGWAQGMFSSSVASTAVASMFSSVLIRYIPPLPGVTADLEIITQPATGICTVAFFGDPWASSANNAYSTETIPAPVQFIRPTSVMVTSIETRTVAISPDVTALTDTQVGSSQIWTTSAGTFIRFATMQLALGNNGITPPFFLGWNTKGVTIAR